MYVNWAETGRCFLLPELASAPKERRPLGSATFDEESLEAHKHFFMTKPPQNFGCEALARPFVNHGQNLGHCHFGEYGCCSAGT